MLAIMPGAIPGIANATLMSMALSVAGVIPRVVLQPKNVDELVAVVREAYARDAAFAFVGGGTELELGNAPRALDTVVRTTHLANVVEYAPEDQTITVQAGMTIAAVAEVLREHRQVLAIDVADPERATIGGAIATASDGRRRGRYGSIKDNIVGITIVRPDGTLAHGGGKVVKNVAGFDLPKLMVGALGTLGATVAATLRVHPADTAHAAVRIAAISAHEVFAITEATVGAALVPEAIVAYAKGASYDLVVSFAGFERGVEEQMRATERLVSALAPLPERIRDPEQYRYAEAERETRRAPWCVKLGASPSVLADVLARDESFAPLQRVWFPLVGTVVIGAPSLDPAHITQWRERCVTAVITAMPLTARATLEAWGTPPPSFPIMRRLKANFDPKGLCNPGRFIGGL
jgi:glycolate oxidase FAD binding subunit